MLTDTVYRRHKHPFTSPPVALTPDERLHALLQDTLRGAAMASIPFFDQRKVVALLDSLPAMDDGARTAIDPTLMIMLSACVLHERFGLELSQLAAIDLTSRQCWRPGSVRQLGT